MSVVLVLILVASVLVFVGTLRTGAPPMPTRPLVRDAMLRLLPEEASEIHELGAGWGGVALAAARARPHATLHAGESALQPRAVAAARARLSGLRVEVHRRDLFTADLTRADAALTYLHGDLMARLGPHLQAALPEGAVVVSNSFALPGWTPEAEVVLGDALHTRVMRYRVRRLDVHA